MSVITCPIHNIEPTCERTVRDREDKTYTDDAGEAKTYTIKRLEYYVCRCPVCRTEVMTGESACFGVGFAGKTKKKALGKWNEAVGDMQVDKLISVVKTGCETGEAKEKETA